jgi:REP element-mobilizing transposase RayT
LRDAAAQARTEIWSYCLMPNHVHIILMPRDEDGLWRTFGDLHRRYTGYINARMRTTGHLWQGRFGSVAMDEAESFAALRRSEGTGRPIGDEGWLRALQQSTGRSIVPRKPGRKGKVIGD